MKMKVIAMLAAFALTASAVQAQELPRKVQNLADQNRILSTAWALGDCNNQFVLMIVSKEGELVFLRKGELSDADKEAFYETIEKYK